MGDVRAYVGTSGWQYRDWRARLYPPGLPTSKWLTYYAGRFGTVEVNTSFYRLPSPDDVRRWAAAVPEDFVFAFKANRYLTHIRRLRDCEEPIVTMWNVFTVAGPKLGPVLFQLPPTLEADLPRLESFVGSLPTGIRAAFEFRHPSWLTEDVVRVLEASGSALVRADRPGVRADAVPVAGGWSYLRFHQGRRTSPGYATRKLREYADSVADLVRGDVFAYFNNDTGGAAVRDARTLVSLLARRNVRVAA